MGRALSGCCAGFLERFVQPQQISGKNSHRGVDDRRGVVIPRRLPAVVIGGGRNLGRQIDAVASSGQIRRRPDVVRERFLVSEACRQPAQRIRVAAEYGRLLHQAKNEELLVPGHPVPRDAGRQQPGKPHLGDADPSRRRPTLIGHEHLDVTTHVPHATKQTNDRSGPPSVDRRVPPVNRDILERALIRTRQECLMQLVARTRGEERPAGGKCVYSHRNLVLRCGENRCYEAARCRDLACSMPRNFPKRGTAGDI